MRAVGLVTEYNPFHNGHLHHLRESLRVTGAEASVAVMSGHFLQRGEPAMVDKWVRTGMALATARRTLPWGRFKPWMLSVWLTLSALAVKPAILPN